MLALQDWDTDNFAGHLIAVAFAQVVIQMALILEVLNVAVVIA